MRDLRMHDLLMRDGNSVSVNPKLSPEVSAAALNGLTQMPKTLPPKLFYDAEGCRLFAAICDLPEYYVTRTELALLKRIAPAIGEMVPNGVVLVEYGAGSAEKSGLLAAHLRNLAAYVPIDVAESAVSQITADFAARFPNVPLYPLVADFMQSVQIPKPTAAASVLGFFPGSTIGNLDPHEVVAFLARVRADLGSDAAFLVGVDLLKDPAVLVPAYDDGAGVTAAFNRNVLTRLNREAAANFDLTAFRHQARWNADASRIELHLVSKHAQTVEIAGTRIGFAGGESIHTESSYKHSPASFARLAEQAGWRCRQPWTDPSAYFGIFLLT